MAGPRERRSLRPNRAPPAQALPPGRPVVRRGTVRLPAEIAARIRSGHPWVYREAMGGRALRERTGEVIRLVDPSGDFVGSGLYEEGAVIAVRVFTRDPREDVDAALAARRVRAACALRRRFVPSDVEAYRVVHGEADGLPGIAVDRYGDYLVAQLFSNATMTLKNAVYDALEAELHPAAIYEQLRVRPLSGEPQRGPADLVRGQAAPVELEVREGPLKFLVDVTAPVSPGLFLDLRDGRRCIGGWAAGRRVLNLFSYTGAISVYAMHGGASEIVAVDVAAKAHARARRNFAINGFDAEKPEHLVGDVQKVVARMGERGRRFDLVVLDPPAFGTGGQGRVFSAVTDYRDLVESALGLLPLGGLMCAVSSTHKIGHEDFDRMLAEGAARAHAELRVIERRWLPADFCVAPGFPEGNYMKFAVAVRV